MVTRFTLIALVAWACRPSPEPAGSRDPDTAAALAKARTVGRDLALSSQNYQRVRFVSDIEKVRVPKPVTQPETEEVVTKGTDSVQVEPIPEPTVVTDPETPPVTAPDSTTEVATAPRVPSIIPRDAPMPEAVGGGGVRRGPDHGADPGGVVGVVIRGGRVGDDHCRPGGGNRPPIPSRIPNRFPIRLIIRR